MNNKPTTKPNESPNIMVQDCFTILDKDSGEIVVKKEFNGNLENAKTRK